MDIKIISSLEKIFADESRIIPALENLYVLRGENCFFQIVIKCACGDVRLNIDGADEYDLYEVKDVPVGLAIPENAQRCTVLNGGRSGMYPDLLVPLNGNILASNRENKSVFVKIPTENMQCGKHKLTVTAADSSEIRNAELEINISASRLCEQSLIYTNWFHNDCLAVFYDVPVFSEEHWTAIDKFMKNAAEYGMNCILTPLFTPPLDTEIGGERPTVQLVDVSVENGRYSFGFDKLKRYINLAFANGMQYIEFSHLFTQWGANNAPKIIADTPDGKKRIFGWETDASSAEYEHFLSQFGKVLKDFTDSEGITHRCFVHCSDEPGDEDLEQYRNASGFIKKYFGAYRHIDALSSAEFYKNGLIDIPVPAENHLAEFKDLTDELWTYYCCGQYSDELPNRFIAMPSVKVRILGALLYKFNIKGFLQWGFNFYFTQQSKRKVNPFEETDAGGAFSAGDAFIVYPGENFEPFPSLRQFVMCEGLCDMRALQTLESLTSRERALEIISDELGDIDFNNYPLEPSALLNFRKRLYNTIENVRKGD